jgi:hypothetical protein
MIRIRFKAAASSRIPQTKFPYIRLHLASGNGMIFLKIWRADILFKPIEGLAVFYLFRIRFLYPIRTPDNTAGQVSHGREESNDETDW